MDRKAKYCVETESTEWLDFGPEADIGDKGNPKIPHKTNARLTLKPGSMFWLHQLLKES